MAKPCPLPSPLPSPLDLLGTQGVLGGLGSVVASPNLPSLQLLSAYICRFFHRGQQLKPSVRHLDHRYPTAQVIDAIQRGSNNEADTESALKDNTE